MDDIAKGVEDNLIPLIHQDKHQQLFPAVKEILREDSSIAGTTIVGVTPDFEKDSIITQNSFYEAMTLSNIMTYAITQTENDKCKAAIHEIGKDYVDSFANSKDKVFSYFHR